MTKHIALLALIGALFAACQFTVVPPNGEDAVHRLDEPIALNVGQSMTLTDAVAGLDIDLTFLGVLEDTRCPDSRTSVVMCTWSGAVEVEMLAMVDDESETFGLIGITDYDGVVEGSLESETDTTMWFFAGYHFVLQRVIPYPGDERPKPEEYVATIIVRRAPEPLPTPTATVASIERLIDESGLPLMCVSELALAKWAAGDTESIPFQLTRPIAAASLPDVASANEICTIVFDDEWRSVDDEDVDGIWSIALPDIHGYWIWDNVSDEIVEH